MKILLLMLGIITICSCERKTNDTININKETPKALQQESSMRYSKSDDLVEELYQELVSKSTDLQNLETVLEEFHPEEVQNEFNQFNIKSTNFYLSANSHANSISDSVSKARMVEFINKSNSKYFSKTAELVKLNKIISNKNNSLADSHAILKIILATTVIEKFQTENLPHEEKFQRVIKKEDSLVRAIKDYTPKY